MKESYNFYRKMLPIVVALVLCCTNFNTFAKGNYFIYPNDLGVAEISAPVAPIFAPMPPNPGNEIVIDLTTLTIPSAGFQRVVCINNDPSRLVFNSASASLVGDTIEVMCSVTKPWTTWLGVSIWRYYFGQNAPNFATNISSEQDHLKVPVPSGKYLMSMKYEFSLTVSGVPNVYKPTLELYACEQGQVDTFAFHYNAPAVGDGAPFNSGTLLFKDLNKIFEVKNNTFEFNFELLVSSVSPAVREGNTMVSTFKIKEIIFTPVEDANTDIEYICANDSITLEAIVTTEPDVVYEYQWYANKVKIEGANEDTYTCLPKDIDSVYCVVKSNQPCSDSTITNIIIITRCFTLYGTVFPFVQEFDFVGGIEPKVFNDLFTVTARLYPVPTVAHGANPIKALLQLTPLHTTTAFYYNGDIHVPNTPNDPGVIGTIGNPGHIINWVPVGYSPQLTTLSYSPVAPTFAPTKPVGIYRFNDVKVGDYVLMLSAPGFAYRYGVLKIHADADTLLGHRELIPGDINCDALIDHRDLGIVNGMYSNYPTPRYNLMFDVNKDGKVDTLDSQLIINTYGGFSSMFYKETWDWVFSY